MFRTIINKNYLSILEDGRKIDELINQKSRESENNINEAIYKSLLNYKRNLGEITFKDMHFRSHIEVESVKSHGKICSISLPSKTIRTEIGDILFNVDHIVVSTQENPKIVNGVSSVIQTKKEDYVKQGIDINQLYLMSEWPKFSYKNREWNFDVFKDIFSFYLFITKNKEQRHKSSMISSSLLLKLLNQNKSNLLNQLGTSLKLSNINLIYREKLNSATLPFSFTSFFIRMFNLSIGSQSLSVRHFCRELFFPQMEEVEDCPPLITQLKKPTILQETITSPKDLLFISSEDGDDELNVLRFKIYLKQLD